MSLVSRKALIIFGLFTEAEIICIISCIMSHISRIIRIITSRKNSTKFDQLALTQPYTFKRCFKSHFSLLEDVGFTK